MGCAQSTPELEVQAPAQKEEVATSDVDLSNMNQGCSTVEMFEAAFRVAEPLIRNAVMKALIYHDLHPNLGLRKNEKPLERFDESDPPLHPFVVKPKALHLLTYEEFEATQSEWKNFKWPENLRALWDSDGFIAADLLDLKVMLRFKPGVELYYGSSTASVELGSDKSSSVSDDAFICIKAPRMRVWWSSKYMELSLAFIQPPEVDLNLSCNLDLWGMDVATQENMDGGLVDSLVEHIMSGFGPHAALKPMPGFAGKVFGWTQETFLSELGNGRPYVIKLSGKPRDDACAS
jgi:hypothetical protein